jgi:hypothetical protein
MAALCRSRFHAIQEEMMIPRRFLVMAGTTVVFLASILAGPWTASAQQMSDQEKKMMEMMMKYGTPGKQHELLKKYVGEWDVETTAWPTPGAEPVKGKGMAKNTLLFDGRYVKSGFEGAMMGMNFKGMEVIGYDLFQNKYVTFWVDNMSTAFMLTTGTLDASGKVLTDTGEYPDPMTEGKTTQKVRNVTTFLADGKYKYEMFMIGSDGKETKSFEFIATRKKM